MKRPNKHLFNLISEDLSQEELRMSRSIDEDSQLTSGLLCPDNKTKIKCHSGDTQLGVLMEYDSGNITRYGIKCATPKNEAYVIYCPGYYKPNRIQACVGKKYGEDCTWYTSGDVPQSGKCYYEKLGLDSGKLFCANADYKNKE